MGWQDLLAPVGGAAQVLPWLGGPKVHGKGRSWRIKGRRPPELGWHTFKTGGDRKATFVESAEPDDYYGEGRQLVRGYLTGDRLVADTVRVDSDPTKLFEQTEAVHLVEMGLERFSRAVMARDDNGNLIYLRQEFPQGPEFDVQKAYQDRCNSVTHISGVSPALDFAFRWEVYQRVFAEERAVELQRLREEELAKLAVAERFAQALKDSGTGAGRRALAQHDFGAAARASLAISGAELLDYRQGHQPGEMVVQYRFRNRRLECVCHKDTLQIIAAGVCLTDHNGTKGDTYFTLESLPPVVGEAMDQHRLVVMRHLDNDYDDPDYDEDW